MRNRGLLALIIGIILGLALLIGLGLGFELIGSRDAPIFAGLFTAVAAGLIPLLASKNQLCRCTKTNPSNQ